MRRPSKGMCFWRFRSYRQLVLQVLTATLPLLTPLRCVAAFHKLRTIVVAEYLLYHAVWPGVLHFIRFIISTPTR